MYRTQYSLLQNHQNSSFNSSFQALSLSVYQKKRKRKEKALSSHQNLGFFFPFSKRGSMEVEQKQAQVIEHFVKQASSLQGSSLVSLIVQVTSHSSLFAFSEILAVPNVLELQGTGYAVYIDLLRLFAHGTWSDYKSNASRLPPLVPDQITKLKQLTVLSLAEMNRVISYDQLLEQLDLSNVRELEDFLINDCMYAGIVKGKLDHLRRSFEVQFAAGRDLRPGQLGNLIQTLDDWLDTTNNALLTIEEKIKWADKKCELDAIHKKAVKDRVEEVKKSVNNKLD
ncbi:COP9 signalosome complex subunit 7-like isoform X2 [Pyrus communis]|uniref:COP9 signalosome complex subunit 7-like isoform X2 n=1 Tax=Pyrus communis TaxID=23211 RepID=UPI0035BFC4E4